jgi:cytochrome c
MRRFSLLAIALAGAVTVAAQTPGSDLGRPVTPDEIRNLGAAIAPDGNGLPEGAGSVSAGRGVFALRCSKCHGDKAQGDVGPALVGGRGTLATPRPLKTVGSFWPYATTLWDYINRAMPFAEPRSLSADDVYAVTAYVLFLNGIIPEHQVLSQTTLASVKMPNRNGFIPDNRANESLPRK